MRATVLPSGSRRAAHRQLNLYIDGADIVRVFPAHLISWDLLAVPERAPDDWPNHLVVSIRLGPALHEGERAIIRVPEWLVKAWLADEPLNGMIDWLIENKGDEYPWLAELLNRIEWPVTVERD